MFIPERTLSGELGIGREGKMRVPPCLNGPLGLLADLRASVVDDDDLTTNTCTNKQTNKQTKKNRLGVREWVCNG